VVAPLCRDIETDLRLHVHSTHLKGAVDVNPTKVTKYIVRVENILFLCFFSADINYVCVDGQTGVRNLSWYLQMRPLRLPVKFIDVKLLVENHLNSAFYTYSVMPNYDDKVSIDYHALPMADKNYYN
jgi:WASH complex subunit 7